MANTCEMEMRGLIDSELDAVSGGGFFGPLLSRTPNTLSPSYFNGQISHSFNSLTQTATNIVVIIIYGNNDTVIVTQTAGNAGSQTT
jgi:hypothetical protein